MSPIESAHNYSKTLCKVVGTSESGVFAEFMFTAHLSGLLSGEQKARMKYKTLTDVIICFLDPKVSFPNDFWQKEFAEALAKALEEFNDLSSL